MGYSVKLFSLLFVLIACIVENTYGFSEGDVRLIGGYSQSEGTVLIYHDHKWGSICDSSWDIRDARVVCRQLGYSGARRAVGRSYYGIGRCNPQDTNSNDTCDMRWMSGLRCRGYEEELSQCNFRGWGTMHRRCHAATRSAGVECVGDYQPVYRPPYYRYRSTRRPTTRRTTTTTTTTPKPTTTTTTPVPTTTTTTPLPTTTTPVPTTSKPTTQKPTTTEKPVPHYKSLQQDEQYISNNDINFDDMPNHIQVFPDVQPAEVRLQAHTTTSTPRPTTTTSTPKPTTTTSTPKPTTTSTPKPTTTSTPRPTTTSTPRPTTTSTPKPTTTSTPKPTTTSTPKPTTTPRVPHPFVTTRRPQHRTTRRTPDMPDVQIGVWFKDEVLEKWVLFMHTGMVLVAEAGHSPDKLTENEYLQKRNEKMMGEIAQADESFNNVIVDETPVEGGSNQIDLSGQVSSRNEQTRNPGEIDNVIPGGNIEHQHRHRHGHGEHEGNRHINKRLQMRLRNGRSSGSGRLEVMPPNSNRWGVICGDKWSLKETMVACRQLGVGYGQQGTRSSSVFGGQNMDKHFAAVTCIGNEQSLKDCQWSVHEGSVSCSSSTSVAGIICARRLPDLEPDIRMLQSTAFLQDKHLYYLTCAMEEKCLSSSAYDIQRRQRSWGSHTRRLLRFSSVVHNKGTADFRPVSTVDQWEWHACHRHYHSMDIFAHYDVLDRHGNRVAEGLKASFCLEDSKCQRGVYPRYACAQIGNQGISVGCSDNYMHDIDCQWIDMTDVPHGSDYTMKIEVNPHMLVPEISFDNNVITCKLHFSGYAASLTNCELGSLL